MKTYLSYLAIWGLLCAGGLPLPAADQGHLAGPKGGRLLEKTKPKAEFYLEKDRTVTITFYDDKLRPVPAASHVVTVVAEGKEGKARIEFEKKGDVLVSKGRIPEGEGYNLVVQLRQTVDSRPQNYRFKLETHTCGGCQRAEYACHCHE